jgi:hypothetical protein
VEQKTGRVRKKLSPGVYLTPIQLGIKANGMGPNRWSAITRTPQTYHTSKLPDLLPISDSGFWAHLDGIGGENCQSGTWLTALGLRRHLKTL